MGAGIAAANVRHQLPVLIFDAAPEALQRTVRQLQQEFGTDFNSHIESSDTPQQLVSVCQQQDELRTVIWSLNRSSRIVSSNNRS